MSNPKPLMFKSATGEEVFLSHPPIFTVTIGDEWVEIPAMFHRMAMAAGCIRNDMSAAAVELMQEGAKIDPGSNESQDEIILAAMRSMAEDDNDDDFTSSGFPNLNKLRARVGFGVERDDMTRLWGQLTGISGDDDNGDAA